MIHCKNCNSINIKVLNLDFARAVNQHDQAVKFNFSKRQFHCLDCETDWNSDPEAYKAYYEYADLLPRTTLVAHVMKPGGTYTAQYIKPEELTRRKELAKILFDKYRSFLDIGAGEWYDIELDAK